MISQHLNTFYYAMQIKISNLSQHISIYVYKFLPIMQFTPHQYYTMTDDTKDDMSCY